MRDPRGDFCTRNSVTAQEGERWEKLAVTSQHKNRFKCLVQTLEIFLPALRSQKTKSSLMK